MNRPSENDETNAIEYVWDKYVFLIFAILIGIELVTLGIPYMTENGMRNGLPIILQGLTLFFTLISIFPDEIGMKKLGKAIRIIGLITFSGTIITTLMFKGINSLIPLIPLIPVLIFSRQFSKMKQRTP